MRFSQFLKLFPIFFHTKKFSEPKKVDENFKHLWNVSSLTYYHTHACAQRGINKFFFHNDFFYKFIFFPKNSTSTIFFSFWIFDSTSKFFHNFKISAHAKTSPRCPVWAGPPRCGRGLRETLGPGGKSCDTTVPAGGRGLWQWVEPLWWAWHGDIGRRLPGGRASRGGCGLQVGGACGRVW